MTVYVIFSLAAQLNVTYSAMTEIKIWCLFMFLFSFEFPLLKFLVQKGGNFKIIVPVPYPIIYNPGFYHSLYK